MAVGVAAHVKGMKESEMEPSLPGHSICHHRLSFRPFFHLQRFKVHTQVLLSLLLPAKLLLHSFVQREPSEHIPS